MMQFNIYMKNLIVCLFLLMIPFFDSYAQHCHGVKELAIINEFTSNTSTLPGQLPSQFIEIVVIGDRDDPSSPVNLSGWMIDDGNLSNNQNNGYITLGSCFNNLMPGTIILLYDSKNPPVGVNTENDGTPNQEGVYQVSINSTCISGCTSSPSYSPCTSAGTATWNSVYVSMSAEKISLFDENGTLQHEILTNSTFPTNTQAVLLDAPKGGGSLELQYGCSTNAADYTITPEGMGSPGEVNSVENGWLINRIMNGTACTDMAIPCSPYNYCASSGVDAGNTSPDGPLNMFPEEVSDVLFSATYDSSDPMQAGFTEIRVDQPHSGSDDEDEFVEVSGVPGSSLDNHTIIVIGDAGDRIGIIEEVISLDGFIIPEDGSFLISENSPLPSSGAVADLTEDLNFEDSDNITFLLVTDFTGLLDTDLDSNDDGILDLTPWGNIVDGIGIVESPNPPVDTEFEYASSLGFPTVGPDNGEAPHHVVRYHPTYLSLDDNWTIANTDPETFCLPTELINYHHACDTPGFPYDVPNYHYIWIAQGNNGIAAIQEGVGLYHETYFDELDLGAYCISGLSFYGDYEYFTSFNFQTIQEVILAINQGVICGDLSDCIDITVLGECSFANFVMPAEGRVDDEIVLVEISATIPDDIIWQYNPIITEVADNTAFSNKKTLIFDQEGTYTIEMHAFSGDCLDIVQKSIVIFRNTDEVDENDPSTGYTRITDYKLFPNPVFNKFNVEVQLEDLQDIKLTIYDGYGIPMDVRKVSGSSYYFEEYDIHLEPGIYTMVLQAAREWRSIKFVVQY